MLHTLLTIIAAYFVLWIIIANFWLILVLLGILFVLIGIPILYMFAPSVLTWIIIAFSALGLVVGILEELGWIKSDEKKNSLPDGYDGVDPDELLVKMGRL